MRVIDYVFFGGWAVFWIYWLVAALSAKEGPGGAGSGLARYAGLRVAVVILVVVFVPRLRGLHAGIHSPVLWGVGLALWALGLGLAIWARRYLGRNWGMPMSQKADTELVRTGPYRAVRHPIYSGIILAMIGTAIGVGITWLIAAAFVGAYFIYSAFVEERTMTKRFPDEYPAYKRSSKMLIPFIF